MAQDGEMLAEIRLLVGYLGERRGWWTSDFFDESSTAFLNPIFGRSIHQARFQGVTAAAGRVHDERIGVGRSQHIFRMPELIEQDAAAVVANHERAEALSESVASESDAEARLEKIAVSVHPAEGPVLVGEVSDDLSAALGATAGHYLAALQGGYQTFPYLKERQ